MTRFRDTPVCIEINGRFVRMLQLRRFGSQFRVHAWSVFPRLDTKSDLSQEAARIAAVFDRRGFAGRDVAFCLPDDSVLSAVIDLPPLKSGAPIASIAAAEIGRMFKQPPDALELAHWELPMTARHGGAVASMVVACPHATAQPLIESFDQHDLRLKAIVPRATALIRACVNEADAPDSLEIVISVGWTQSRFYAVCSGLIVLDRVIENAGLETLHRVVAGTIGVDTELAAIALKDALRAERELLTDPDAAREVQEHIRHYAEAISSDALTALSYLARRFSGRKAARILVVCDGDEAPDLARELASRLSFESRVCSIGDLPFDGVETIDLASRRALLAVAGLCLNHQKGDAW
ncbi:MAG: hypothetical protein KF805_09700 [Phycisphaeraceae bacterium]|nr:hypothetical protein [Phycisphaeraceae bacterium]